jgi:hypothetical protein
VGVPRVALVLKAEYSKSKGSLGSKFSGQAIKQKYFTQNLYGIH